MHLPLVIAIFASVAFSCPIHDDRTNVPTNADEVVVVAPLYVTVTAELPSPTQVENKYMVTPEEQFTGPGYDWPSQEKWVSFDQMFAVNQRAMNGSCNKFRAIENNSPEEIDDIKAAILSAAKVSGVDKRFILAIIIQESHGCVRVPTTIGGHPNPGLMQDFKGLTSCNTNTVIKGEHQKDGVVYTPCSSTRIRNMINEGTFGTLEGPGLAGCLNQAAAQGAKGDVAFYWAARIYNSGFYKTGNALELPSGGNICYVSEIANRLLGWAEAPGFVSHCDARHNDD